MPTCNSCHKPFPTFSDLAHHIAGEKKGHKRGKAWAHKYLMMNTLSAKTKRNDYNRQPLTDEQKEAKMDCIMEISGMVKPVKTVCPKCHEPGIEKLPVEYIEDPTAWRKDGKFVRLCNSCEV